MPLAGLDAPVERCDIDHTVPWPFGPTHPSNNKPYCRTHHLIKTFYTGPGGWTDQQLPDGTVILTAPTGHTYTTEPHGGACFRRWHSPRVSCRYRRSLNPPPSAR